LAIENILMPKLGESVTEGTIEKWLVKPGDKITKYDPIAEVNTDKVNAEIPSLFTGTIKDLIAKEGETLDVGALVCVIETEGTDGGDLEAVQQNTVSIPDSVENEPQKTDASGRYSPAVLRLSQDNNIDLKTVKGSGLGGRITRKDLLALIESGGVQKVDTAVAAPSTPEPEKAKVQVNHPVAVGDTEIPVTGVRRAIANNMVRASQEVPHAWMMIEVDVTNLVQYRDSVKEDFKKKEGFNLTYFAFFVNAVSQALKEFPMMNSMWAGDKIIQKKDINISIAVANEDSLFVPVIKQADEKTIKGLGREINDLATKARSGKITSADMQDGTFTVNNTGSFGSIQSMGIINYPQAAILQVESIVKRPVIMEGNMFAARDMVNLCLSLDHRVLDGLFCGRFLARVKEILENVSAKDTVIY